MSVALMSCCVGWGRQLIKYGPSRPLDRSWEGNLWKGAFRHLMISKVFLLIAEYKMVSERRFSSLSDVPRSMPFMFEDARRNFVQNSVTAENLACSPKDTQ